MTQHTVENLDIRKRNLARGQVVAELEKFILFFFFPLSKKEKKNPAHTSRRSNQRLAKELQFCLRTRANLLL
ncbi:MAG: hypothetical protein A2W90_21495 [Bacteroidetes bacterium GWF2_42_66]|nr:MAG: hypothetical protein A2W92_04310 [Bacteroidetes bacterium GWA2_42_15]OFX98908.1 MAG: hypothetical protein A2W89_13130 [Bacteroidetes bacterium GWE2_42_39]OFY45623.1 MAG: hypothetical protein A2W90_21495 [Bacteroidetes bacterium GWF2_42_66]HBL77396.1 hypothetical protein [Prolixibacteraceae bacterium]HCU62440.1 hypothetical protein [Prolixibacteraceae bacterium]